MTAHEAVHPGAVLAQAMAFQPARLVLTGIEIGLFTELAKKPATEDEIRERLGLHTRGTDHFLAALVELGFLERSSSGEFRNSRAAQQFLVPGDEGYLGGFLRIAGQVMYPAWDKLGEALRTGAPQAATYTGEDMFGELYESDEKKDGLVGMAEDASRPLIPALTESFGWAKYSSVLELGGCRGNVLAGLAKAHPHLDACVFDLPQLEGDFSAHMSAIEMAGKVRYHGGDFFADPLPQADVLMIGHALVDWNDEQRKQLVKNTFDAVRPGGAFLVWDPVIVDDDESYLRNLIRSLNLQLMTPHGKGYRFEQCAEWMREAGYAEVTHTSLGHDVTLVVAHKD